MKWPFYVFCDQANDGAGGASAGEGGEAAAGDAAAAAKGGDTVAPAAPAATSAPATAKPATTAIEQAGDAVQPFGIPEKYQVRKEDGTLDLEASTTKLAEAQGHLERRLGSGDLPPKTPEEYTIAVPDSIKDQWNPKDDPLLGEFLKKAHSKGYTQAQLDLAMETYMDIAPKLLAGDKALTADECVAELRKEWKDETAFKGEMAKAYKAAQAYGDKDAKTIITKYGNDPVICRMLARIGGELGEDRSIPASPSAPGGQSIESVMSSEAYNNPKHPDHARVSAQVNAHFQKQAKAAEKEGRAPVM